jgi:hypothetical protein
VCFFLLRTRLRARQAPGIPCALCFPEGRDFEELGRHAPRECESLSLRGARDKLRSNFALKRRSNPVLVHQSLDCFASLAMTTSGPVKPAMTEGDASCAPHPAEYSPLAKAALTGQEIEAKKRRNVQRRKN